jgi:hypothetical protein
VTALKGGGAENEVVNNAVGTASNAIQIGVNVTPPILPGTKLRVQNNVLHDGSTSEGGSGEHAVAFSTVSIGSSVEVNYNVYRGWLDGLTNAAANQVVQVGNTTSGTISPDNVTGVCTSSDCVNQGHPSTDYTDHDLSRNDRGVAGGSFRYTNFWPILTGGARVYIVKTPRTVLQSSTINAEADGHDR